MDTEKRALYFIIITFLFLIGYMYFISKFYPQQTPLPPPHIEAPQREKVDEEPLPPSEIKEERLTVVDVEDFVVTFSTTGGYIKKLYIKEYQEDLSFQNLGFIPEFKEVEYKLSIPKRDSIVLENKELGIRKVWEFGGYRITFSLSLPQKGIKWILFSNYLSSNMLDQRYQELFYKESTAPTITRIPFRKIKKEGIRRDNLEMVGARERYFCFVLYKGRYTIEFNRQDKEIVVLAAMNEKESKWEFYIGPQIQKELAKYNLEEVINYGFFHGIAVGMIKLLYLFYFLTKNWGLSIILFSTAIYGALFPLTFKSSKSMREMREFQIQHQLEIKKLREKYKDQPHKIHQATLDLYKKYGVNPLKGCSSGCLPMFFQIPIIWAFWSLTPRFIEFKGTKFLWIKDLSLPDKAFHLPFSLPYVGEWINILPLLTAIIMYLQMRFANPEIDPEQAQQQRMMALMFPIIIGGAFYHFPSALLLYWFTNSILTFFSQWKIMKAR
jgi:YidC/Oxa1 family membrane protein insertase